MTTTVPYVLEESLACSFALADMTVFRRNCLGSDTTLTIGKQHSGGLYDPIEYLLAAHYD